MTSNMSCRISCGGQGLAMESGKTLKGEEVTPLPGSPVCANHHPPTPPTLNVHQRQSQALAGRGGGHAAQCCFGTFWGKERLLVGCSDSSVFPASEAKQAGSLLVSISEPTPLPSAASSWAMAIQLDSAPPWGACRAGRPSPCAGGPRLCSSRAGSSHLEIQQANILTRMCDQRPGDGLGFLAGLANQPGDWSRGLDLSES